MKDNQKPFVIDLIMTLIDRTNDGTINWVPNAYLTKSSAFHFDLDLDTTKIDVKIEIDESTHSLKREGWLNIKDPNLSEPVFATVYKMNEVSKLQLLLYTKYVLPNVQKIKDTDSKDIEVLSNINNKFGKQYIRDRKLSTILGTDELTSGPTPETWKDRVKKILNK